MGEFEKNQISTHGDRKKRGRRTVCLTFVKIGVEEGLVDECERKKDLGRKREGSPERVRLKNEGNMVNTAIRRAQVK